MKNYRDEFDPLFPNRRRGWHKRAMRSNCSKIFEKYKNLDIDTFTGLIKSMVGYDESAWSELQPKAKPIDRGLQFAQRLMTGLAAEQYFESVRRSIPDFDGYAAQNTTRLGCGYDFRMQTGSAEEFLAVEVKGLRGTTGTLSLTPKEHEVAESLGDRFFLFVVKNFRETPFHELFRNPLAGALRFRKTERVLVQVSWLVNV